MSMGARDCASRGGNSTQAPITRPIVAITVSVGKTGQLGGFPFEALLMLVLGFAVRTDAGFAISGLLPLRLALDMVVDRRLDLVLLGFLAIDFSVEREVYGEVSSPKQRSVRGAHRCALALAVRERRPALGPVNLAWLAGRAPVRLC